MEALGNLSLKDIVIEQPEVVTVLEKYGLDFCCRGKQTLQQACNEKQLDYDTVEAEIAIVLQQATEHSRDVDYNAMGLDDLVDHIIEKHHIYTRQMLPLLHQQTQKVAGVYGERHPELVEIAMLFEKLRYELEDHMMKEERILFPYIKDIVKTKQNGSMCSSPFFGSIGSPIAVMESEHEQAGEIMERIRVLSDQYHPPLNACTTYRVSFKGLEEFEKDLHKHVHLENNILFPKVIQMEKSTSE